MPFAATLPAIALLLFISSTASAVQLSDIFNLPEYEYFPSVLRTFRDGTVVIAATATFPIPELSLPPFVKFPPLPEDLSETIVLARVHPQNLTVIWAAAIAEFENVPDVAVDPVGNTYVVAERRRTADDVANAFRIVKYGPRGRILWARDYDDPSFGNPSAIRPKPGYWLNSFEGSFFRFTRGRLAVAALRPFRDREAGALLSLSIEPVAGNVRAVRPLMSPKRVPDSIEKRAFDAAAGVSCFASLHSDERDRQRLFIQCHRLAGGRTTTRELPLADSKLSSIQLGMISGEDRRSPQVFVVFSSGVDGEKLHQIFAFRLNARTLENVDWATGKSRPEADQVVINFSTPRGLDRRPGFVVGAHFSHPSSTLVVLYTSGVGVKKVVQTGDRIRIQGSRISGCPAAKSLFLINSTRSLEVRPIERDPRGDVASDDYNNMLITRLGLSADEETAYLYGYLERNSFGRFCGELESGPLYIHPVPIVS